MLLAARGVVEGIQHVKEVIVKAESGHAAINKRVEKDKKHFGGVELVGKTLAVCGLGNIGAMVAEVALSLGMEVVGYDPKISVEAAWRLSSSVKKANSLQDAIAAADFVSINMPYIKGVTHHALNEEVLSHMKPTCHILNFARAEIIDGTALQRMYKAGHVGKYICDFPDEHMMDHPKFICIPHLGASTEEAEAFFLVLVNALLVALAQAQSSICSSLTDEQCDEACEEANGSGWVCGDKDKCECVNQTGIIIGVIVGLCICACCCGGCFFMYKKGQDSKNQQNGRV